jgi:hypothetical protein
VRLSSSGGAYAVPMYMYVVLGDYVCSPLWYVVPMYVVPMYVVPM